MRLTSAAFFSMLDRRHLLLQHTNRLARQFTWKLAGTPLVQRRFPKFVPRTNKLAAQCVAERHAAFRFAPKQIGGAAYRRERRGFPVCTRTNRWCSPATSDSQKEAPKETCHQTKPRKEEEPSSTAAHSPTRTPHRTPHIQNVFSAQAKFISAPMRPALGGRLPPTPLFPRSTRRLPQSQPLRSPQRPAPLAGVMSLAAARVPKLLSCALVLAAAWPAFSLRAQLSPCSSQLLHPTPCRCTTVTVALSTGGHAVAADPP